MKRFSKGKQASNQKFWIIANGRIRSLQVRVIDEQNKMLGVMATSEAVRLAYSKNMDLVQINDQQAPPIAKIIELNKYKYQLQQKEAASRKKSKAQSIKEVRLTPFMSDGDFGARLKKIEEFLKKGNKVRLSLQYKGRQITKKEFGESMIVRAIGATSEYANVEIEPKMIGRKLMGQLTPKKKI